MSWKKGIPLYNFVFVVMLPWQPPVCQVIPVIRFRAGICQELALNNLETSLIFFSLRSPQSHGRWKAQTNNWSLKRSQKKTLSGGSRVGKHSLKLSRKSNSLEVGHCKIITSTKYICGPLLVCHNSRTHNRTYSRSHNRTYYEDDVQFLGRGEEAVACLCYDWCKEVVL